MILNSALVRQVCRRDLSSQCEDARSVDGERGRRNECIECDNRKECATPTPGRRPRPHVTERDRTRLLFLVVLRSLSL